MVPEVVNNGRATKDHINTLLKDLEKEKQTADRVTTGGFRRRPRRALPPFALSAATAAPATAAPAAIMVSPRLSLSVNL